MFVGTRYARGILPSVVGYSAGASLRYSLRSWDARLVPRWDSRCSLMTRCARWLFFVAHVVRGGIAALVGLGFAADDEVDGDE